MKEEKNKIGLKDISSKELNEDVKETEKTLKEINNQFGIFKKIFNSKNAQVRLFLLDAFIENLLIISKLSPYTINSILWKYILASTQVNINLNNLENNLRESKLKRVNYAG